MLGQLSSCGDQLDKYYFKISQLRMGALVYGSDNHEFCARELGIGPLYLQNKLPPEFEVTSSNSDIRVKVLFLGGKVGKLWCILVFDAHLKGYKPQTPCIHALLCVFVTWLS